MDRYEDWFGYCPFSEKSIDIDFNFFYIIIKFTCVIMFDKVYLFCMTFLYGPTLECEEFWWYSVFKIEIPM